MAYVAITENLRYDIRNHLDHMRNKELEMCGDLAVLGRQLMADKAFIDAQINKLWEPLADIRQRLEEHNQRATLSMRFKMPDNKRHDVDVTGASLPCFVKPEYGEVPVEVDRGDHPVAEQLYALLEARHECLTRWAGVKTQVLSFINKCKSLNEAVKLWPDVRKFLPSDALRRLDNTPSKTKPKAEVGPNEKTASDVLKEIDLDVLNSSLVLARMAGATT
jgi:hypothetical protein